VVIIQVILVAKLKGSREKIGVRSYEKAEKVEPGKVKLCILETRQGDICSLHVHHICDCDDKLARIEAKTGKARAKERTDLAFSLLTKRIISSKKEKLWGGKMTDVNQSVL
jgi:hypothetical protein